MVKVKLTLIGSLRALTHNPNHLSSLCFSIEAKNNKVFCFWIFWFCLLFFLFWPCYTAYGILVPQPGIEPIPLAMKARSPNHWTARETIGKVFFFKKLKKCYDALLLFFSHSVMSDALQPHGLQHARLPSPSLSPGVCSNSCPLSQWCHSTLSPFVIPFSSFPQSFPASESFPVSRLFASGGHSFGVSASASVLPMNIQGWLPLGLTDLIPLLSKGLSRVFSSTTVWKH